MAAAVPPFAVRIGYVDSVLFRRRLVHQRVAQPFRPDLSARFLFQNVECAAWSGTFIDRLAIRLDWVQARREGGRGPPSRVFVLVPVCRPGGLISRPTPGLVLALRFVSVFESLLVSECV